MPGIMAGSGFLGVRWVRIVILVVPVLLFVLSVFTEFNSHWFQAPRGTLSVMGAMTMVLPGSFGICVHIRAFWMLSNSLSVTVYGFTRRCLGSVWCS